MTGKEPNRIAIVTPYYYPTKGGVQEHVYHLKEEYKKLGHYTKVITGNFDGGPSPDEKDVIRLGRGLPVATNGSVGRVIIGAGKKEIIQALNRHKFDVFHLQEPFVPFLSHKIINEACGIKVGTFHASFESNMLYAAGRPFLQPLWEKLDGKTAVSETARASVNKYFKGDVEIIPNGISLDRFRPGAEKIGRFTDGKLNILFVGRIEKRKGLIHLVRAYGALKKTHEEIRLIVVGTGPMEKEIKEYARKNKIEDINFEGYAQKDYLPRYYATSHIFCSPAVFGESFGIVLLEAMASGVPVAAFDIPGYRDVISEGRDGLLAEKGNEKSLGSALEKLITKEGLRKKLGSEGLKKARNLSWSRVARLNLDYYKKLWKENR